MPECVSSLRAAVAHLSSKLEICCDSWVLIGSAAMALHGVDIGLVDDIDVMMSPDDARRLLPACDGVICTGGVQGRFCSEVYFSFPVDAWRVEVMAGMNVRTKLGWEPVGMPDAVPHQIDGEFVNLPSLVALAELCTRFGRPKDLVRRALIEAYLQGEKL